MKKIITVIALLFFGIQLMQAQMDDKFYYPNKKMAKIELSNFKEVSYTIEKDTIASLVFTPLKEKAKATILYFHGAGGNVSTYVKFVQPLIEGNFNVIMVDFRGYGKSTGKPTHLNIASDAQIIFNKVIENPIFKNQKILIYGASMGTQVATNLAKNNQNKINGLILDGCISSFTDIAADSSPKAQQEMIRQYLTSPYSAKEDIKTIKNLPILFIHSKEDKSVPLSHQETVFNNSISVKKSVWIYTGEHLMAPVNHKEEFVSRINAIIK
jgi:alpha-beta hydrolase superfamily lysophospholipase